MPHSRRDFFRHLPAVAALPASWASLTSAFAAAATTATPDNEDYWSMVKRQFPLADGLIYLNAANVCPASRPVMDRHLEFLRDFHANPSFQNREKYGAMHERLRGKIAAMLRVSADEIAVTRNTSEGTNIVVRGIDLKAGDEILITDHNHPSNNDSWKVRARRDGLVVRSLPVPVPGPSSEALLASLQQAITARTRVIAITHVTSTVGLLYPAKAIARIAAHHNIWMHLDGAQTFGALDVDLKDIGCDSFSTSAHKWMMGPLEAGILYVRADRIPQVWPSIVTAGWSDRVQGARKFEVFGQRDDPRIASIEAAVDFLQLIGMKNVEARVRMLAGLARQRLRGMSHVELKTNVENDLVGGVVKFNTRGKPVKEAYDQLWSRARIATSMTPSGDSQGIRFSPHIYNSRDEIERALEAVAELAG